FCPRILIWFVIPAVTPNGMTTAMLGGSGFFFSSFFSSAQPTAAINRTRERISDVQLFNEIALIQDFHGTPLGGAQLLARIDPQRVIDGVTNIGWMHRAIGDRGAGLVRCANDCAAAHASAGEDQGAGMAPVVAAR